MSRTTRVLGFVPGFKRPGSGVDLVLPASAEIIRKDRRFLYVLERPRGMFGLDFTSLLYTTAYNERTNPMEGTLYTTAYNERTNPMEGTMYTTAYNERTNPMEGTLRYW